MAKILHPERQGLHVRVVLGGSAVFGPGRADLLQGIDELGSIAAAGRAMGMSYRRAWLLADAIAKDFGAPVLMAAPGGAGGGGARLTDLGAAILAAYRRIEDAAQAASRADMDRMEALRTRHHGQEAPS